MLSCWCLAGNPLFCPLLGPAKYTTRKKLFYPLSSFLMCYVGQSKLLISMGEKCPDDTTKDGTPSWLGGDLFCFPSTPLRTMTVSPARVGALRGRVSPGKPDTTGNGEVPWHKGVDSRRAPLSSYTFRLVVPLSALSLIWLNTLASRKGSAVSHLHISMNFGIPRGLQFHHEIKLFILFPWNPGAGG